MDMKTEKTVLQDWMEHRKFDNKNNFLLKNLITTYQNDPRIKEELMEFLSFINSKRREAIITQNNIHIDNAEIKEKKSIRNLSDIKLLSNIYTLDIKDDDKEKKKEFNVKEFSKYFMKQYKIINLNDSLMIYTYERELYERLTEELYGKLFMLELELKYPNKDLWNLSWEEDTYIVINRLASNIKTKEQNERYIPVDNGIYDIQNKELLPNSTRTFNTYRIPVEYIKGADCKLFKKTLIEIFEGEEDMIRLMQEIFGYCIMNTSKAAKTFIFTGIGNNGKSLIANIIIDLLGKENVSGIPLNKFNSKFGLQNMIGKLANISSENQFKENYDTEKLKAIVSGDPIEIDIKYEKSQTIVLNTTNISLTNDFLNTRDLSNGLLRRLELVPFNKVFTEEETDRDLREKIVANEMKGVLNFAIEGAIRLKENNYVFTKAKNAEKAIIDYKQKINPVEEFVQENIEESIGSQIDKKTLIEKYRMWLASTVTSSNGTDSNKSFWRVFESTYKLKFRKNVEYKKSGPHRFVKNIRFKNNGGDNDE